MLRGKSGASAKDAAESAADGTAEVAPLQLEVPRLAPSAAHQLKDNIVPIEISEYAGYAGLIAANGGLEPSEHSVFFRNGGFKVRLTVSEEESWSALNSGALAGSVTTADVLAVYGRQFQVVVPAQIGFSRGADGLVVRSDIGRINGLRGKTIAAAQFTEVDFFIRYLAQEAGLATKALADLNAAPDPTRINLVYTEDGFSAGDLFLQDLVSGKNRLAGAVTWEPKTSEVVDKSGGQAKVLTTNKNLLIVADILVLNKGFAEQHPQIVAGLVQGLLEGNRMVRDNPEAHLDVIARALKWSRQDARSELTKVHLSNLPENLAFFSGAIDAAGSFGGIYQSAVYAYGPELIRDPVDPERFVDLAALKRAESTGAFSGQQIAIAPIRSGTRGTVETNPLLSKDIRFLFQPNSSVLDLEHQENLKNLDAIKQLLQVSPGSTILLRGHVDNALVPEFRRQGGEAFVRQMALKAVELSKNRAAEIRRVLHERLKVDAKRLEVVGRGWDEPAGTDSEQNRRVEVQWFTVE
jgi:NitT/TauT family transport system substrate-binding protein